jgi:hypothetical protein
MDWRSSPCIKATDEASGSPVPERTCSLRGQRVREEFEITISDNVDQYLGGQVERLSDGSVKLMQPKLLSIVHQDCRLPGLRFPDEVICNQGCLSFIYGS